MPKIHGNWRIISARDLELIYKLFRRWSFVLVADIDEPKAFFILADEEKLSTNNDVVSFLENIIKELKGELDG